MASTASLLAGPFAYGVSTISRNVTGPFAAAGSASSVLRSSTTGDGAQVVASTGAPSNVPFGLPAGAVPWGGTPDGAASEARSPVGGLPGLGNMGGDDLSVDDALITYLQKNKGDATYLVAVQGSSAAVPLILATGQPVMAMGGFSGGDPAPTLAQLQSMVAHGMVHYVLISVGRVMGGPGGPGSLDDGSLSQIAQWVIANGTAVSASEYGGSSGTDTLYYLP